MPHSGVGSGSAVLAAHAGHVQYCFDVLSAYLSGDSGPIATFDEVTCPLFITWNKESRNADLRLRGCIGTLEPRPLRDALKEYALTSALRDRRFPPISRKELAVLHCTVSLLSAFEPAADWLDWTVGMHGLIIQFDDPLTGMKRTATFLPEVAAQEHWGHQQTIDSLIRKAGYVGTVTPELRASLSLTRYRSTTATLSHAQYMRLVSPPSADARMPVPEPAVVAVPA